MKKFLLILIAVAFLATPSFAGVSVGVFGGYTMVSMSDVNSLIDDMVDGIPVDLDVDTRFGNAWIVGFNLGFNVMDSLTIGPRVEIIGAAPARIELDEDYMEMGGMLVPIMVGATYAYAVPDSPVAIGGELYLGYGIASAYQDSSGSSSEKLLMDGGCFAAEIAANVGFTVSDMVSLGIKLGYRISSVAEMKYSEEYYDGYYKKGDVVENADEDPLVFDFSGLIAGGGITLNF